MNERIIALFLALFFGGIGIHKFFCRRCFQGILYLVVFPTGISVFLGVIDAFRYLFMSDAVFEAKYRM